MGVEEIKAALGADVVIPVSGPAEALEVYSRRQKAIRDGEDPQAYAQSAARMWRLFAFPTHGGHLRCPLCLRVSTRAITSGHGMPVHTEECPLGQKLLEAYGSWDELRRAIE